MKSSRRLDFWSLSEDAPDVLRVPGGWVVAFAAMLVVAAHVFPVGPARGIVAIPLVLLVPGWAAFLAIFGRVRPPDVVVRLIFVVALGMGVLILNGLVVNSLGLRLSQVTLVAGPGIVALVLLAVAWCRGADTGLSIPIADLPRVTFPVVVLCASLAIGAGAVAYAANRLPTPASPPFAELAFAPSYARAPSAPAVAPGANVALPLQLRLVGLARASYTVHTYVDGVLVGTTRADAKAPLWTGTVSVAAPRGRCLHQVRVVFTPVATPRAKTASVDTYLSVTGGGACPR